MERKRENRRQRRMDGEQQWRECTQAEEVSEGIESPLKTQGLFNSGGRGSEHMGALRLVTFMEAVLRAAKEEKGLLRWEGLRERRPVSSHSQGSAAKHRHSSDSKKTGGQNERQTDGWTEIIMDG